MLDIRPEDLAQLEDVERDAHGNVRIAEVNIGEILKAQVQARLKKFGIKTTIVAKNIGYELRCADPIPFDMEYTRDLGYCAAKYLLVGRQRGDGLDAGRPLRADPVRGDARPEDRPGQDPAGGHPLDALRDRAALHDPAAARRLRGRPRARQVRGHLRHAPRRSSATSSSTWSRTSRRRSTWWRTPPPPAAKTEHTSTRSEGGSQRGVGIPAGGSGGAQRPRKPVPQVRCPFVGPVGPFVSPVGPSLVRRSVWLVASVPVHFPPGTSSQTPRSVTLAPSARRPQ